MCLIFLLTASPQPPAYFKNDSLLRTNLFSLRSRTFRFNRRVRWWAPRQSWEGSGCASRLQPVDVSVSLTLYCRLLQNGKAWEQNWWVGGSPIPFVSFHAPPPPLSLPRFRGTKVIETGVSFEFKHFTKSVCSRTGNWKQSLQSWGVFSLNSTALPTKSYITES